jgi:uncharacterized protein involved in exopolysaccharide biosynthesis
MDLPALPQAKRPDQISLRELLQIVASNRWIIIGVTLVFTLGAAGAALVTPKSYKASILISPVSESSQSSMGGGLGALASQFSGLASLAGVSLEGSSKTEAESQAVLQSEALTERYMRENNLLPILYPEKWDSERHTWKPLSPSEMPTPWKAFRYFDKKIRTITTDAKSGLLTMSITWKNPRLAAQWANDLVKLTNSYLRDKAVVETDRNIAYLNGQAANTDVVPVKQAIYSLMENEINKAMIARGSDEFAFKVLDPAAVPERASSPQFLLWTLAGLVGGLILSTTFVLLRVATMSPESD